MADLNSQLMNLAGLVLSMKQMERQKQMGNLEAILGLGGQMGFTPEMYKSAQESAKKAGINFPDISSFTQGQTTPAQAQGQQPQGILSMLAGLGETPNSPMLLAQQTPSQQPFNDIQGLAPEEQQLIGPARTYKDFADEVSSEMGVNPANLIGGEPLKKFRQESSMRYRQYLKDRDAQIKGLLMENRRESRALKVEDKRWQERAALEVEKERAADERQAARDAASEKRLEKSLSASEKRHLETLDAAEKRAYIRERGDDRRLSIREQGIENRTNKRIAEKENKKKLVTIYSQDGRTKMVPVPTDQEYEPPTGWSTEKPSKEEKAMQQLLKQPVAPPKKSILGRIKEKISGGGKVPVYDISGKLLRYE